MEAKLFRIVTGISGSGKTTYSKKLKARYISFDNLFNYQQKKFGYNQLANFVKSGKGDVVMDGFIWHHDPVNNCCLKEFVPCKENMNRLLAAIKPHEFKVTFIYSTLDHLFDCQRSTPERRRTRNPHGLSREEEYEENRQVLLGFNNAVKCLLADGTIKNIEYIYRLGAKYQTFPDESHFLKLMEKGNEGGV